MPVSAEPTMTALPPILASSPDGCCEEAIVVTKSKGLVVQTHSGHANSKRRSRRTTHYVSRHFNTPQEDIKTPADARRKSKRSKCDRGSEKMQLGNEDRQTSDMSSSLPSAMTVQLNKDSRSLVKVEQFEEVRRNSLKGLPTESPVQDLVAPHQLHTLLVPEQHTDPPVFLHGINVAELSSDSSLTDVPDVLVNPFESGHIHASVSQPERRRPQRRSLFEQSSAGHESESSSAADAKALKPRMKTGPRPSTKLKKSPYFPHPHKHRPTFLSTLPFPPLHLSRFGLMQERLCHDPFRLLIATIFLNKTPGSRAMPIFFKLMDRYPTPAALAEAEQADVTAIIQQLGFQNQRARKCIAMAAKWVQDPPIKGRRRRKKDYPTKGATKDLKDDEIVDDQDPRAAWEISHLPGLGPYSHDSWRMFCRDELRGLASSYNGEGSDVDFEPEWKRVCPVDKELRAWMTWSWMKEGFVWNKETGESTKASEELMELARCEGNVVLESEKQTLEVHALQGHGLGQVAAVSPEQALKVGTPAGGFINKSGR